MSYLQLPNGVSDFSKAIISLWFRVPKASMDAAYNTSNSGLRLAGIVPLMTFGSETKEGYTIQEKEGLIDSSYNSIQYSTDVDCNWVAFSPTLHTYSSRPTLDTSLTYPINPSFVGLQATTDDNGNPAAVLKVFLQAKTTGTASRIYIVPVTFLSDQGFGYPTGDCLGINPASYWNYLFNECFTDSVVPTNPWTRSVVFEDQSEIYLNQFGGDAFDAGAQIPVEPDTWHHALISFDLDHATEVTGTWVEQTLGACDTGGPGGTRPDSTQSTSNSLKDPCKIWIAFDDENITGDALRQQVHDTSGFPLLGQNEFLPRLAYTAVNSTHGSLFELAWGVTGSVDDFRHDEGPPATYKSKPALLTAQPLGIPATAKLVDSVYHVEMAEFQMWTGKTLDTEDINNRRAFIDAKGKPVPPNKKPTAKDPTSGSIALLGEPDVTLHGSGNWVKGRNTGTTGTDADGKDIPSGQFKATGKIKKYKPEPSLHGPQSPATKL